MQIITTAAFVPIKLKSQRIPFKNIRKISHKFLFEFSIETALQAKQIEAVILSSESDKLIEYLKIKYRKSKKKIYFLKRDLSLSSPDTTNYKVMQDAIIELKNRKINPLYLVLLQPTHPFRSSHLIDKAIKCIKDKPTIDSIISINIKRRKSAFKSQCLSITKNSGSLYPKFISGNYYIFKVEKIKTLGNGCYGETLFAFNSEPYYEINIDRYIDLWVARRNYREFISDCSSCYIIK